MKRVGDCLGLNHPTFIRLLSHTKIPCDAILMEIENFSLDRIISRLSGFFMVSTFREKNYHRKNRNPAIHVRGIAARDASHA
jgi:hypothetical protein